jgi:beta-mannosidase
MEVHVTSDLVKPVDVSVSWRLETIDGKCLSSGGQTLRARALADTRVGLYDFSTLVSAENQRKAVFVAELWQEEKLIARSVTPFVANKHLELRKPGLKGRVRVEDQTLYVDISSRYLARFVELSIDGADAVFSDNYFDVPAGTTVTVSTPLPEGWTAESTVQARSLYDSFA